MKQRIRTFLAIEISSEARAAAASLVRKLSACRAAVKWIEPENMHLTLKFVGEVDLREVPELCSAAQAAAAEVTGFGFTLAGAGAFPTVERPRTIWLGVADGAAPLAALHERIEKSLKRIGYAPESRAFKPHLTLGRVKRSGPELAELTALLRQHAEYQAGVTLVDEVTVFSSELSPEGPIYHALAHAELRGE